jgi:hypothetical protein
MSHADPRVAAEIEAAYAERAAQNAGQAAGTREWWEREPSPETWDVQVSTEEQARRDRLDAEDAYTTPAPSEAAMASARAAYRAEHWLEVWTDSRGVQSIGRISGWEPAPPADSAAEAGRAR